MVISFKLKVVFTCNTVQSHLRVFLKLHIPHTSPYKQHLCQTVQTVNKENTRPRPGKGILIVIAPKIWDEQSTLTMGWLGHFCYVCHFNIDLVQNMSRSNMKLFWTILIEQCKKNIISLNYIYIKCVHTYMPLDNCTYCEYRTHTLKQLQTKKLLQHPFAFDTCLRGSCAIMSPCLRLGLDVKLVMTPW